MSNRQINVELNIQQGNYAKVAILVEAPDGKDLSAQEIIDAVSDVLIMEWEIHNFQSLSTLDS